MIRIEIARSKTFLLKQFFTFDTLTLARAYISNSNVSKLNIEKVFQAYPSYTSDEELNGFSKRRK